MVRLAWLWLALGAPSGAWAQDEGCETWSPEDFAALADDARDALEDDDAARVIRVVQAARARVGCLSGPVPSGAWARLLYARALVAYAQDEVWEPWVDTALWADPDLARTFGPPVVRGHRPASGAQPIPQAFDRPLWIDGQLFDGRWPGAGPHVLQSVVDERWRSVWVDDPVPDAGWVVALGLQVQDTEPGPPEAVDGPEAGRPSEPAVSLRVHAAVAVALSVGPEVWAAAGRQPPVRVSLPVEVGLAVEPRGGFVRVVGSVSPQLTGPWVYTVDGVTKASRWAGGGHLAGGGRIGIGHLGSQVGVQWPGRVTAQAVGGVQAVQRLGLRVELRAGVHVTTGRRVEPFGALALVFAPRVWATARQQPQGGEQEPAPAR